MATKQDFEILEIISEASREAKEEHLNLEIELSGKEPHFKRAISAIRRAGMWNMAGAIFDYILYISALILVFSSGEVSQDAMNIYYMIAIFYGVFSAVLAYLGWRAFRLNITPAAICATFIFATIFVVSTALFISMNIFTLVAQIPMCVTSIIALIHWSTYRSWFYSIDTEYYQKEESRKIGKTKKRSE